MKRLVNFIAVVMIAAVGWGIVQAPIAQADSDKDNIEAMGYNPSATAQLNDAIRGMLGEKTLKGYHHKIHQNGTNCQLCHSGEAPTSPPNDNNCVRCHGTAEHMADVTSDLERNPHNSPHYGTYVPCATCHMEHQPSKLLCADCHTFKFDNFKK